MTDLTVLIPTWNRASILRETLEALCLVRTGNLSVNFVVVDNASTDDTPAVLREFAQRLPLTVLREPRAGKCNALNRGLRQAALGEIVVFTDDDGTPDPSWFEEIAATCRRWPAHSVFGGRVDPAWPSSVPMPLWAADKRIQAIAFTAHHMSDREGPYPAQREPFGPNFWVRRSALAGFEFRSDLGPHPTRRTLCDESEFLRRMRRQGHEPIYSPTARMVHRVQADRLTELALCRRAYQYGRGEVHVTQMPEATLLRTSRAAWYSRVVSNVAVSTWQLLGAALEPEENVRVTRMFARAITLGRNFEALCSSAKVALSRGGHILESRGSRGSEPSDGPQKCLPIRMSVQA
jgi:glycosyltransferase involved in cell wall biosynthesis